MDAAEGVIPAGQLAEVLTFCKTVFINDNKGAILVNIVSQPFGSYPWLKYHPMIGYGPLHDPGPGVDPRIISYQPDGKGGMQLVWSIDGVWKVITPTA
jgi:hypothetical protein